MPRLFVKGQSGNPRGRPKSDKTIQEMARSHAPAAIEALAKVMKTGTPAARVAAAAVILDRGYGKAPAFSTDNPEQFKSALEMTDAELAAIAAGSRSGTYSPPASPDKPDRVH